MRLRQRVAWWLPVAVFALPAMLAIAAPDELLVPAPAGWSAVDQEYRYGRETLWQYIDGAAEVYLTYRFRELVVADFEQGGGSLTVSVYDMGFPLDAYGIFETEKPAKAADLAEVGAAAVVQAPYQGLLIKDRYFVRLEAGGGDVPAAALQAAMRDVADGLPGTNTLPPELAALPAEGRVPGSVAYAGNGFLGLADLGGCLHAEYEGGYRLFVMTPSAAFLRDEHGRWTRTESGGRLTFVREIPYRGVVVLTGDETRLLGVVDAADEVAARAILASRLE